MDRLERAESGWDMAIEVLRDLYPDIKGRSEPFSSDPWQEAHYKRLRIRLDSLFNEHTEAVKERLSETT